MSKFLNNVRDDRVKIPTWKFVLFCAVFLMIGAGAGIVSKLADVYTEIIGTFTSGMCLWIFLGTVISVFSKNPFRAAAYVFLFCAGMIAAYYVTAEVGGLYYSMSFVKGWSAFTAFTPVFAYFAWYARGRGAFSWFLRIGIYVVTAASVFLLSGNTVLDVLAAAATVTVTIIKIKEKDNGTDWS